MRLEEYKELSRDIVPISFLQKLKEYDNNLFIVFNEYKKYFEVFQFIKENVKPFTVTCCKVLDNRLFSYLDEHRVERKEKITAGMKSAEEKREEEFQKAGLDIDKEIKKIHKSTVEQQHFSIPKKIGDE